jgi:hypothetical protein
MHLCTKPVDCFNFNIYGRLVAGHFVFLYIHIYVKIYLFIYYLIIYLFLYLFIYLFIISMRFRYLLSCVHSNLQKLKLTYSKS